MNFVGHEAWVRLAPMALWLAVLWAAESFVANPPAGRVRHGCLNLGLAAFNGLCLFFTLGALSIWVCSRSAGSPHTAFFGATAGHAVCCFLALDLFSYGWHRLNHALPRLWRLHAVHHSDAAMDVTTSGRFHVLELGLAGALRLPVLYVLGVSPLTLLVYESALVMVSMFHHSRLRLSWADQVLRALIVTPAMHSLHHARDPEYFDRNFGSVLSIWDRLFRTYRSPIPVTVSHGLPEYDDLDMRSPAALLVAPFRDLEESRSDVTVER